VCQENRDLGETIDRIKADVDKKQARIKQMENQVGELNSWKLRAISTVVQMTSMEGSINEATIFDRLKEKIQGDLQALSSRLDQEKQSNTTLRNEVLDYQNVNKKLKTDSQQLAQLKVSYDELLEEQSKLQKVLQDKAQEIVGAMGRINQLAESNTKNEAQIAELTQSIAAAKEILQSMLSEQTHTEIEQVAQQCHAEN
jgi:chromosome segregation ATPase